jgi:hypothetical protein
VLPRPSRPSSWPNVRSKSWPQRLAIPDTVQLEEGFSRDVRSIGHFATGDLELRIKNAADFAKAPNPDPAELQHGLILRSGPLDRPSPYPDLMSMR